MLWNDVYSLRYKKKCNVIHEKAFSVILIISIKLFMFDLLYVIDRISDKLFSFIYALPIILQVST